MLHFARILFIENNQFYPNGDIQIVDMFALQGNIKVKNREFPPLRPFQRQCRLFSVNI